MRKPKPIPTPPPPLLWGARMDGDVYGRGDAPWDTVTWATFEQHAGRKVDICHFGQPAPWKQAFAAAPFDACKARGALPLCSMGSDGVTLADIAAGKQDAAIQAWSAAAMAWGGRILLRWCWEMNGSWYAWGKEPAADYVAAWRHLLVRLPSNVELVWCPNVIFNGSSPLADRWPGPEYVAWLAMDGYNFGTNPLKPDVWRTFTQTFKPTYDQLAALSTKPIVICETACTEYGGDKAGWIIDMFTVLPGFPQVKALVWFNWNIVQGSGRMDWPIESSPAAQAAFRNGVAGL